jgi:hypothetical protein
VNPCSGAADRTVQPTVRLPLSGGRAAARARIHWQGGNAGHHPRAWRVDLAAADPPGGLCLVKPEPAFKLYAQAAVLSPRGRRHADSRALVTGLRVKFETSRATRPGPAAAVDGKLWTDDSDACPARACGSRPGTALRRVPPAPASLPGCHIFGVGLAAELPPAVLAGQPERLG